MKNKIELKTSKKLLIIGLTSLCIGIILTIILANKYIRAESYWINNYGADEPLPYFIIGIFIIFFSFPVVFIGLTPYITKLSLKLNKESMDLNGEDMTNIGKKSVDISKPIVDKSMDDIIIPSFSKFKTAMKDDNSNEFCPKCGDKIDNDEIFCSNCGSKLKVECDFCGFINKASDNFCKKCGNKLK